MNLRDEIPPRAFINAEIMQQIRDTATFTNAIKKICRKYNIPDYQFENPAYIISLLYCLIVIPKEQFLKNADTINLNPIAESYF